MKRPSMTAFIDSLIILKTIMIGVIIIIGIFLLGKLDAQTQQTKALAVQNNKLSKQIAASNQDIKSHIDCIITFFGLPNRQALSIRDVCHITSSTFSSATPNTSGSSGANAPQSQLKASSPLTQSAPNPENKPANSSQSIFTTILNKVKEIL